MRRISALIIALLYLFDLPLLANDGNEVAMLFIVLAGIPHGASDHVLSKLISQKTSNRIPSKIILNYIVISLVYFVVWIIAPFKALLIFIAISVFHFGQEYIEHNRISSHRSLMTLLWGSFVLLFPLVYHSGETVVYIQELTEVSINAINPGLQPYIAVGWPATIILVTLLLFQFKRISKRKAQRMMIDTTILSFVFLTLPLIPAFAIFFIFWHSADTYQQLFNFYRNNQVNWDVWTFVKSFVPLSLVSFAGLVFLAIWIYGYSGTFSYSWIFVFIALISMPHIFLFDYFYQHQYGEVSQEDEVVSLST